ncbi:uncharacterized protein [Physcomitrium patens]|uniref:uncharacterized protein isoform X2 n=1 Tax=Physcomitrium patens TaxID=3218 RepID=UPI003CCD2E09
MGFQRQGRGTWPMGISVFAHGDQEVLDILRPSLGYSRMYDGGRSDQIGLRAGSDLKNSSTVARVKRASHSWRSLPCSVACILVVIEVFLKRMKRVGSDRALVCVALSKIPHSCILNLIRITSILSRPSSWCEG